MLTTRFTELVGCSVPIQQAPIGSVASPALAVAVANAGGVGSIAAFGMTAHSLDEMLADMTSRTSGVLTVNFVTNDVDREAVAVAARRVRIVDFFWSDPDASLVEIAHAGGALACWQVGSLSEAQAAAAAGCDLIAVQGVEAGGHVRGYSTLLPLLAAVLDEIQLPVLAAGGIGGGRALAAVLAAGAAGARMGTRFIATDESGAHPDYKQAVVDATAGSTAISGAFAICPLCATSPRPRVLRRCISAVQAFENDVVGEVTIAGKTVPVPKGSGQPPLAGSTGAVEAMVMYAGESVAAIHEIAPAAKIIEVLCAEAERLLAHQ